MGWVFDKWHSVCEQDNIEHLTIPRSMLLCWGMLLLVFQVIIILACSGLFVLISGVPYIIWIYLFRSYYMVWKRYYSIIWPILVHILVFTITIYISVRFL